MPLGAPERFFTTVLSSLVFEGRSGHWGQLLTGSLLRGGSRACSRVWMNPRLGSFSHWDERRCPRDMRTCYQSDFLASFAVVVVHLLSRVQLFATPGPAACQAPLSFIVSWSLLKFMTLELVMPSNHLILCHPLLCLQSFPASGSFPMSQFLT